jgi:hypothetical protein
LHGITHRSAITHKAYLSPLTKGYYYIRHSLGLMNNKLPLGSTQANLQEVFTCKNITPMTLKPLDVLKKGLCKIT